MTDYICPECGTGFPEDVGKVRVEPPYEDCEDRLTRWTCRLMDAMAMRTYYAIRCPECEHIIGGDDE